mmetsp:Transcript_1686/g.5874  ORF Transcript_1686/g.5874 Transcript_1686/m.5874 type:complete len:269 (-) Transcript_1686:381-1187(-)
MWSIDESSVTPVRASVMFRNALNGVILSTAIAAAVKTLAPICSASSTMYCTSWLLPYPAGASTRKQCSEAVPPTNEVRGAPARCAAWSRSKAARTAAEAGRWITTLDDVALLVPSSAATTTSADSAVACSSAGFMHAPRRRGTCAETVSEIPFILSSRFPSAENCTSSLVCSKTEWDTSSPPSVCCMSLAASVTESPPKSTSSRRSGGPQMPTNARPEATPMDAGGKLSFFSRERISMEASVASSAASAGAFPPLSPNTSLKTMPLSS